MRRRVIHIAAALSLVLCIGCLAGWMRSRIAWDRFNRDELTDWGTTWRRAWTRIDSSAGRIDLSLSRETRNNRGQLAYLQASSPRFYWSVRKGNNSMPTDSRLARFVGVFGQMERGPDRFFIRVIVPYWMLAGLFAALPVVTAVKSRRRKRIGERLAKGLCAACGYDLRATPERCPECGAVALPLIR